MVAPRSRASIHPLAGPARRGSKSKAAFTSDGRRPRAETSPAWAKVSLTTPWLPAGRSRRPARNDDRRKRRTPCAAQATPPWRVRSCCRNAIAVHHSPTSAVNASHCVWQWPGSKNRNDRPRQAIRSIAFLHFTRAPRVAILLVSGLQMRPRWRAVRPGRFFAEGSSFGPPGGGPHRGRQYGIRPRPRRAGGAERRRASETSPGTAGLASPPCSRQRNGRGTEGSERWSSFRRSSSRRWLRSS